MNGRRERPNDAFHFDAKVHESGRAYQAAGDQVFNTANNYYGVSAASGAQRRTKSPASFWEPLANLAIQPVLFVTYAAMRVIKWVSLASVTVGVFSIVRGDQPTVLWYTATPVSALLWLAMRWLADRFDLRVPKR
ncbi:hypothetical protein ACIRO1_46380 [Streptomyces sp. NPDC102381]|uniref:hypothetical protein n=1 Tax=Streptomyces sp. NPDC102381 TaxID=3366164 RepID=UPI00382D7491